MSKSFGLMSINIIILVLCLAVSARAEAGRSDTIITGIEPDEFLRHLRLHPKRLALTPGGWTFFVGAPDRTTGVTQLTVAVLPTVRDGEEAFRDAVNRVAVRPSQCRAEIGQKVAVWESLSGETASVLFLQSNVFVHLIWSGSVHGAVSFAQKIDQILTKPAGFLSRDRFADRPAIEAIPSIIELRPAGSVKLKPQFRGLDKQKVAALVHVHSVAEAHLQDTGEIEVRGPQSSGSRRDVWIVAGTRSNLLVIRKRLSLVAD